MSACGLSRQSTTIFGVEEQFLKHESHQRRPVLGIKQIFWSLHASIIFAFLAFTTAFLECPSLRFKIDDFTTKSDILYLSTQIQIYVVVKTICRFRALTAKHFLRIHRLIEHNDQFESVLKKLQGLMKNIPLSML